MKRFLLLYAVCSFFQLPLFAQDPYWQQEVDYNINVTLNDEHHSLNGQLALQYTNHSPDTLTYIWFHLWPNAYKNDSTALAKQLATGDSKKNRKETGYIDSLQFKVDGKMASTKPADTNIDVVKLSLPAPLLPGKKINITTPFFVQLPSYYSRSGHDGHRYMVCQWYPKPAVYDKKGWHAFPYLDQGEFYSEYGTFKVNITLPAAYVVGATGTLQTTEELNRYKELGKENNQPGVQLKYRSSKEQGVKTLSYSAENVHDFAWFADKDFVIRYDTLQLPSGKIIDVFSYGQPNGNKEWSNSVSYTEDAVRHYSKWIGEYDYPTVQVVEGPANLTSGGMEYPMITLITSPGAGVERLDGVITHEVGHNWFYGMLGSNERDCPWMDEGMNTYFQFRYEAEKYKSNSIFGNSIPKPLKELPMDEFMNRIYGALNSLPAKEPISTVSTGFPNKDEYGVVVYVKTAIWMYLMEKHITRNKLDQGIKAYFNEWKFKHPYPEDLQSSLEKAVGLNLENLFALLNKEGNFQ